MEQALVKERIMERVYAFAEKLAQVEEVQRFRHVEKVVNESPRVQQLIEEIKRTQKELVHAEHYAKPDYKRYLEQRLKELNETLSNMPIVREYQQSQVEMNDLLQLIQNVMACEISKKLNVETGGEVRMGCGSGGPCGCK